MFLNNFFNKKSNNINSNSKKSAINNIMPSYIDNTNPKYLIIDDMYFSGLLVTGYSRNQQEFMLDKIITSSNNINISMFYEKQDSYKIIRDLTYYIGNVGVDIKDSKSSNQDIENMVSTLEDAKFIRKQMQIDKEELFYLYLYINVFAESPQTLEKSLSAIETIALSQGLFVRRANFRQVQVFCSTLPIMQNNSEVKEVTKRNVLSMGLSATYPFISSQICDENGVLYGLNTYNNSLVLIDAFDDTKYKNANMCVVGTSGSREIVFYQIIDFKK